MSSALVKVVEQDGTVVVADLENVNVGPIRWRLNEPTTGGLGFPKGSADAADILLLDREVAIYRTGDTNPRLWGPMISADASSGSAEVEVSVVDPFWYLLRRQVADERTNRLTNGDFAGNITSWTNTGASTDTYSTTRSVLGAGSLKLVQAAAGVDTYQYQQQTFTAGSIGTYFTVVAWVYISSSAYLGPAYESRGLFVSAIAAGPVVTDYRFVEIDDATPRDRWVRLEVGIWIEPGETRTLEVRLYAPGGDTWWDACSLTKMEAFSKYALDAGVILGDLISFAQDSTYGWDDINLANSDATTGITMDRHIQFADWVNVDQAVAEFVEMGIDWSIEFTTTTRTFTSYWPQKGTDRSGTITLSLRDPATNPTGTLSSYRLTTDGSATATRVTVLGEGDGPDREEGHATDAASLGGLVLSEVISAPPQAPISSLQRIAEARLAKSKHLVRILEVVGIPGDTTQINTIVVGDTVAISISDGWVSISGDWRVVEKVWDPATDTCSFVLNEVF